MRNRLIMASLMAFTALGPAASHAQDITAFTYQGQIKYGGVPVNQPVDLRFRLYDASTAGSPIAPQVDRSNISAPNGVISEPVDFGAAAYSTGGPRWIEVD